MSMQPTMIERLNVKHPGLEKDVCDWLKSYVTGAEIAARVLAKYSETVSPKNINNYRRRRLNRVEQRIQDQKISYLAFMEAVGEKGLDAGAAAKLWEALQSMTPTELIAVRRLQLERERLGVLDKRAENEKQKLKAALAQLKKKGAKGGADSEPQPDPLEIRRRIRAIFGLPDDRTPVDPTSVYAMAARRHSDRGGPGESESAVDETAANVQRTKSDDQNCRT